MLYYTFLIWTGLALLVCVDPEIVGKKAMGFDVHCHPTLLWTVIGIFVLSLVFAHVLSSEETDAQVRDVKWLWFWRTIRESSGIILLMTIFGEPVTELMKWSAPATIEPLVESLAKYPTLFLGVVLFSFWLLSLSNMTRTLIRHASRIGWDVGLNVTKNTQVTLSPLDRFGNWCDTNLSLISNGFNRWIAPYLFAVVTAFVLVGALIASVRSAFECSVEPCVSSSPMIDQDHACDPINVTASPKDVQLLGTVDFDTQVPTKATEIEFTAGSEYLITVEPISGLPSSCSDENELARWNWHDASLRATPDGLYDSSPVMPAFIWARRLVSQPWFRLMGRLGPNGPYLPIGKGVRFVAPKYTKGTLELFVNDAAIPCWKKYYKNNTGKATVKVFKISTLPQPPTEPSAEKK